jgi:hypothetical protein
MYGRVMYGRESYWMVDGQTWKSTIGRNGKYVPVPVPVSIVDDVRLWRRRFFLSRRARQKNELAFLKKLTGAGQDIHFSDRPSVHATGRTLFT